MLKWYIFSFGNPYSSFEKDIDSNKTLQKRWYTNGFITEQLFINRGSNKLYSSHWKKKEGISIWNALVVWILPNASNFIMTTEDNSIQRQVYDSIIQCWIMNVWSSERQHFTLRNQISLLCKIEMGDKGSNGNTNIDFWCLHWYFSVKYTIYLQQNVPF